MLCVTLYYVEKNKEDPVCVELLQCIVELLHVH